MNFKRIKSYIVNPLDICVLIIVLSVIIGGFYNLFNKSLFLFFKPTEKAIISITLDTDGIVQAEDFKNEKKVYLKSSNDVIGFIVDSKNVKEKRYSAINNTLLYDYSEKNISVIIEIDAKIKRNGNLKYINNSVLISAGTLIEVNVEDLGDFSGQIDSVVIV